ncbi:MAG: hypothetical protein OEW47_11755 [Thermoleophilia bacterium]|nr:hypothetical protein [Thermoleophilia bacterium]
MLASTVLGAAVLTVAAPTELSATTTIRPPPGTPNPKAMVLTSADLGRARVTLQRYYKDRDFPSVISYEREFEDARTGSTPLLFVSTEAEIGVSVPSTTRFYRELRSLLSTKEGRRLFEAVIQEELGGGESFASIRVGKLRGLGVGRDSLDLPMALDVLGLRADVHLALFRVEQVLGIVIAVGEPGRPVGVPVMTRLAKIMVARMQAQLAPKNTALPAISGSPVAGETLTATPGTWSGNPAGFAYQWQRCGAIGTPCSSIPGASGPTYPVAVADLSSTLRVAVTARSGSASALAVSAPTGIVSGFVDTFSGAQPSAFWSVGTAGTGPTIAQANGRLEVTLPSGTGLGPDGYANAFANMICRLPGDFDMQVDYQLLSGTLPTERTNIGFDATEFTGTGRSGVHGMFVDGRGTFSHFPGSNSFVAGALPAGTLRLTRRTAGGITTTTASRVGGVSWSFTSDPYSPPTSQAASLNVFTNLAPFPTEVRVAYDNFRITSGTISCP